MEHPPAEEAAEPRLCLFLTLSIALPTFFSFVQIFHYGVSLTNLTTAFMVIVFYIFALHDMDKH